MKSSWERQVAWKFFRSSQKGGITTPMSMASLGGILLSVFVVLMCLSVVGGFQKVYQKSILAFNAHLVVSHEENLNRMEDLTQALKDEPVVAMSPYVFQEGLVLKKGGVQGAFLKGVDGERVRDLYPMVFKDLAGNPQTTPDLKPMDGLPPVYVGSVLMNLLYPDSIPSKPVLKILLPGHGHREKNVEDFTKSFPIAGTFENGLYEFDSRFILTSLPLMRDFLSLGDRIDGFEVALKEPMEAKTIALEIEEKLPASYHVTPWQEVNGELFSALKMEKTVFWVIMLFMMLVATFNLLGLVLMTIKTKSPEVALLKSLGASISSVTKIFIYHSLLIGMAGCLLGFILYGIVVLSLDVFGWFSLDPQIYFVKKIPIEADPLLFMAVMAITLLYSWAMAWIVCRLMIDRVLLKRSA